MTTTPIVKLIHGSKSINLIDDGKYWPSTDFVPPATQTTPILAGGTVQNRYSGSDKISETANDISWSFTIHAYGVTDGECMIRARKLQSFLSAHAGDGVTPLQLHYRENSDVAAEPLWGEYGVNKRYEIIHANTSLSDIYPVANLRANVIDITCNCLIKPYANGIKTRLGTATGGILEDTLGTVDGRPRGLIIPQATTNKMTNPVFGYSTWNNGWTTQANLFSSQNTDDEFVAFGTSSAKLTSIGASSNIFYQSLNFSNTNAHIISCYAKKPDGSAVTSSDINIVYVTAKTTTFTSVGNGWYRISAAVTGIASIAGTGVAVGSGKTVYVDLFQAEENPYITPAGCGDMLGWAWTGTAHASTSTRTAATLTLPTANTMSNAAGSILAVVKTHASSTSFSTAGYYPRIFEEQSGELTLYYNIATSRWSLTDGTNSADGDATFSAEETIILISTWGPSGLALYKNGTSIATNATYTPFTLGTSIYIGSDDSSTNHCGFTIMGLSFWDTAMSSTEAAAISANIAAIIADGERVGCIPWLWTKDGDNTVDNANDSSYDNYAVVGGIPGTVEAQTEYQLAVGNDILYLSNWVIDDFLKPSNLYFDQSGTVNAGSSGGEYLQTSVSSSSTTIGTGSIDKKAYKLLQGRDVFALTRINDQSNVDYFLSLEFEEMGISTAEKPIIGLNYFRGKITGGTVLPISSILDAILSESITVNLNARHVSATNNMQCDYFQIVTQPIMVISNAESSVWVKDGQYTYTALPTGGLVTSGIIGSYVNMVPDKYNLLIQIIGGSGLESVAISNTVLYIIDITPRYALL